MSCRHVLFDVQVHLNEQQQEHRVSLSEESVRSKVSALPQPCSTAAHAVEHSRASACAAISKHPKGIYPCRNPLPPAQIAMFTQRHVHQIPVCAQDNRGDILANSPDLPYICQMLS